MLKPLGVQNAMPGIPSFAAAQQQNGLFTDPPSGPGGPPPGVRPSPMMMGPYHGGPGPMMPPPQPGPNLHQPMGGTPNAIPGIPPYASQQQQHYQQQQNGPSMMDQSAPPPLNKPPTSMMMGPYSGGPGQMMPPQPGPTAPSVHQPMGGPPPNVMPGSMPPQFANQQQKQQNGPSMMDQSVQPPNRPPASMMMGPSYPGGPGPMMPAQPGPAMPPQPGLTMPTVHQPMGGPPNAMPGMPPYATQQQQQQQQNGLMPDSHVPSPNRPPASMMGAYPGAPMPPGPPTAHGGPMPGPPHMGMGMSMGPAAGHPPPPHLGGSMPHHPGGMPPSLHPGAMPPQKRLDPRDMPSAVTVMEDDRKAHSGIFPTGYPRAELPPLVTSEFVCEDQGNCNPKFMRSTLYNGPINNDLLKQSDIPFSLVINPVAKSDPTKERPLPVIDMGELGPVRCHRCKAYMCPYMEFNYGGRRFFCPFCKSNTEVPSEYFSHLDQNGQRTDLCERPELCLGSYEFVATKEYCKNNLFPKSPAFIFMLDVSYNALRTGIVKLFCENIKFLLQNLPKEMGADKSDIKIGFATYDQSVHFYSLKSALGQPKMLIVNDVQDTFVPIVDGFLVDFNEAESIVDVLLTQIPSMFAESKITEIVLGPVVQAGMDALKAADRSGKLFIFHTALPIYEAPGKLKNRDDKQIIGTDKEKTVLLPQSEFYTKLAQDCVGVGCCVDIFLFPNSYVDVATIGALCGLTGGQIYKYQYFQADIDGQRFLNDLKHDIERPIVFDAIMRVRTSTGIRPTDFFGSFYMQNTTDVELAALDSDKTVTVEIKHDDKIDEQSIFFQAALLFTSVGGQRRLRIHNLSLNAGADLPSLYRSADLFAVVNYLAKHGERMLLQKAPREVRESMVNRCAKILSAYRQHCSPASQLSQLVLPETMKLLPLMVNCVIKHSAFTGGADLSFDDRAWLMQIIPSMPSLDLVYYFYPRILPVHELNEEMDELPIAVRCAYENLLPTGAYLFENSVVILFWIGAQISPQWIQDVFGVQNFAQINADKHDLPEKDNATSRFVRKVLQKIQQDRPRCLKLYIIKQQDKLEPWFKKFMIEDRGADGSPSYVEFLCHIHKEIRNLLS